jgi:hypothetical protein
MIYDILQTKKVCLHPTPCSFSIILPELREVCQLQQLPHGELSFTLGVVWKTLGFIPVTIFLDVIYCQLQYSAFLLSVFLIASAVFLLPLFGQFLAAFNTNLLLQAINFPISNIPHTVLPSGTCYNY